MNVLITGAGIVGTQIARLLAERGDRAILFDLRPVPEHVGSVVDLRAVEIVRGDVTDLEALRDVVRKYHVDCIAHTAAMLTGPAQAQPRRAIEVNVGGSANVLEMVREKLVRRVILAGSTTVEYPSFSRPAAEPIPEDFALHSVSEAPMSFYSATKLAMEFILRNYISSYGVDAAVVRYGAVIGAWSGPNTGLVSRMIQALLGPARRGEVAVVDDSAHVWQGVEEFVDARDCARGTLAALDAPSLPARVYHVSNAMPYTHEEFLAAVRSIYPDLKIEVRVRPTGGFANFPYPRTATSDVSAARRDLGFEAAYDLRASLEYFAGIVKF